MVVVTGSTGFIGSNLTAYLRNQDLVVLTPLRGVYPRAEKFIHCAGYGQPQKALRDAHGTVVVNTAIVDEILWSLPAGGRFLFISSQETKGVYGAAKLCGETICKSHWEQGIKAYSAMLGHTFGPGTRRGDTRVLNQFIEQALKTGTIIPRLGTDKVITYLYIEEAVRLLWSFMLGTEQTADIVGKDSIKVSDLARLVMELVSGRKPETIFESDLRKTIDYQRGLYGLEVAG